MTSSYGYAIPSNATRCEKCGSADEGLRKCQQCKAAYYCSRDCQLSHWKEHKVACRYHTSTAAALDPKNQDNDAVIENYLKVQSKMIRKAEKDGTPVVNISFTHAGAVGPNMMIPDGVPANFGLKQQALMDFHRGRGHRQFFGEASYKAYYDELVQNELEWMEFFKHPANHEHAEHTCGILGTLATIYRQRETYENCGNVLDMEVKVLDIFKALSSAPGTPRAQISCCDGLEYKMQIIRYNLNNNLKQYRANISVFRDLCLYEAKYRMSREQQNYLFMIEVVKEIWDRDITVSDVHAMSDEECLKAIIIPITSCSNSPEFQMQEAKNRKRMQLLRCGNPSCDKKETALGQFKECQRCKEVVYCGKVCQKKSWKEHKKACCKKK